MEECFLIHRLDRAGDVAVPILERIGRLAPRSEKVFQRRREQIAELRGAIAPLIRDLLIDDGGNKQGSAEGPVRQEPDNLAHVLDGTSALP